LRKEFVRNVTNNHLDVGVGTGYYLPVVRIRAMYV